MTNTSARDKARAIAATAALMAVFGFHRVTDEESNMATDAEPVSPRFALGDHVRKTKGSQWHGRVVGLYSTTLTPVGYAVESAREPGSVQIYPEAALEVWGVCGNAKGENNGN
jgi:hypothetical protein